MPHDTEARLSATLQGIVGDRPYAPDLDQIESRGRKLRHRRMAWRATAGTGFAAAVAAVAVLTTGTQAPAPNLAAPNSAAASSATAENAPLMNLVGYLTTAPRPEGDATLVLRNQVYTDGLKVAVWDVFADNGDLYFAKTRGALPASVKGKPAGDGDSEAGRKKAVAAAEYAAKGDLNEARKRMALAYVKDPKTAPTLQAPGVKPSGPAIDEKLKATGQDASTVGNLTDNWVWGSSVDALKAGAGSPTVRAGVLRLLGQMPEVKVEQGTIDGQPVLTLAAGALISGGGTDSLTINAETGLPIKYVSESVGVTVNYTVTRVTLADVAAGRF
ncbi:MULTISPECIES: hypothetical protein [unclassified Micromonospora]|uniref:hypothetical protein n=1 Tax=unclassified Micromonospora TaxID=2617518 RepID=UPI000EF526E7|nr:MULTISPECIES: hypothetical protein [unclassified Micromonospora]RLP94382.1 hypothetical protein EAD89_04020 [Micromonospora sp. BL4]RLP99408.1 hypothetical protein EAD98_02425 [Micromonospora sp. CV4]